MNSADVQPTFQNPDGQLAEPLEAQKSAMFLKLAQLQKGDKVL